MTYAYAVLGVVLAVCLFGQIVTGSEPSKIAATIAFLIANVIGAWTYR